MAFHVLFTEDGIPGWIGVEPRDGSEELPEYLPDALQTGAEGEERLRFTVLFLAQHMRTAEGQWVPRPPPPEPTAEEIVARLQRQADAQAEADAQAAQWREEEIARRSAPDALLRSMGTITIAQLRERVAAIRAEVEAGR
ncbi:MAG: hypothetical protein MUE83_11185 [Tabrizicola sp.]|jgi:hypothetical protein|nr:hypothetical protein [Tabrizicola sp.]